MKKVAIMFVAMLFLASFAACVTAFAQKSTIDAKKEVKAPEATEPARATEVTIPYSAPYDSPDKNTGADEVEVDEDS